MIHVEQSGADDQAPDPVAALLTEAVDQAQQAINDYCLRIAGGPVLDALIESRDAATRALDQHLAAKQTNGD